MVYLLLKMSLKSFQMIQNFTRNLNFQIISTTSLEFSKNETVMVSRPYSKVSNKRAVFHNRTGGDIILQ